MKDRETDNFENIFWSYYTKVIKRCLKVYSELCV